MTLYLNIPYDEKDEAKKLGAKWNSDKRKWFVQNKNEYRKFAKWILGNNEEKYVLCDYIYIVKAEKTCFKCHTKSEIIALGIVDYIRFFPNGKIYSQINSSTLRVLSSVDSIPKEIADFLKNKHNFYKSYSQKIDSFYYANHCPICNTIHGKFFLFDEIDSPFFIWSKKQLKNLQIYKIPLKNDIVVSAEIAYNFGSQKLIEFDEIEEISL